MNQPSSWENSSLEGPALRTFTGISKAWSLTKLEQSAILGQPIDATFPVVETGVIEELLPETLERISYVVGIYRALHTIFSDPEQADGWIRRPNSAPLFDGASALSVMCRGRVADLASVRRHLEEEGLGPL